MEDLKKTGQTSKTHFNKGDKKHIESKQQYEELINNAMENDFHKKFSDENNEKYETKSYLFSIKIQLDGISFSLFLMALFSRLYKLQEPNYIVFDELHYGKYVSMYIQNTFYFASNPSFGIQLISLLSYLCGYDGNFKFDTIGKAYSPEIPLFALRIVPAFFGSLLVPLAYHILLELKLSQWTALLGALLILFDNAFLTQSRFILMETILICFAVCGIFCILRFCKYKHNPYCFHWWLLMFIAWIFLTLAVCVKYVAFYTYCLGIVLVLHNFWNIVPSRNTSDKSLFIQFCIQIISAIIIPFMVYLAVFYVHLSVLYKAGPHDNVLTSAFQASLEGGLASITKGQPITVAHGSQITLRHSHGRTCWLHSHQHVYPIRYSDKRGSSHQQQVTCYSFKDVNNWWIVKRPEKNELVVENPIDAIKHGDVIQLVHGLTSRALNSHDVAAPMSPQCQEVSCYIDYNISMAAQNLWKVDIINREQMGNVWRAIQSQVRLIHLNSNQALRYSGKQLPDWGFHQHEVVTDRIIYQDDTIWNVEEHVYTKSEDQKDRERDIIASEMIPTSAPQLSFWNKFFELQYKMLFKGTESVQNHMFSSEPIEWPLMVRGIAYWVSNHDNRIRSNVLNTYKLGP
ncbi:protein O-mannosyltransferase 1 isoform X2 [Agrilus planipennis]|uniref:Protein O-mannosyltransferase 1 n=1 Tax=Agrilus planipennis TaxID=224129 RepID=A0A1W4WSS5_AGRPL|nr:protein O-mannosyltransferase 1 isoform X2 [Agrilus planipennis]